MMARFLGYAAVGAVLAALVLLYRTAQKYDPARDEAAVPFGTVTLEIDRAVMTGRTADRDDWRVRVDHIRVRHGYGSNLEDFGSVEFQGLRDGRLYDRQMRQFRLMGSLKVASEQGDTLNAPECIWSESDGILRFSQGAHARSRDGEVRVPSALFSPRTRVLECMEGAAGRFEEHSFQAGRLRWDIERRLLECDGGVAGTRRSTRYSARSARVDLRNKAIRVNEGTIVLRMEEQREGAGVSP
jgi:hypothetical protein